MKKANPTFLSNRINTQVLTLLYDYISFVLFLIFVGICWVVGRPLHYVDKKLHTRLVERLIRFFEFFAR